MAMINFCTVEYKHKYHGWLSRSVLKGWSTHFCHFFLTRMRMQLLELEWPSWAMRSNPPRDNCGWQCRGSCEYQINTVLLISRFLIHEKEIEFNFYLLFVPLFLICIAASNPNWCTRQIITAQSIKLEWLFLPTFNESWGLNEVMYFKHSGPIVSLQ